MVNWTSLPETSARTCCRVNRLRSKAGPGGIYHAVTDRYEIRVYHPDLALDGSAAGQDAAERSWAPTGEGDPAQRAAPPLRGLPRDALVRIFRRTWEPVSTTGAAWERVLETEVPRRVGDDPDPSAHARMRSTLEGLPRNENLPTFSRLRLDRIGNVWIQRYGFLGTSQTRWDVFDPEGRWLGEVEMPEGLQVRDIGDDYVLGIWRDEFEVERVRLYRLRKP